MSDHDPTPEELELQALFDATAEEPSREALHRMARQAAQIPEQHPRVSPVTRWLRRLAPALALTAAATAGWFLLADPEPTPGPPAPKVAVTTDGTATPLSPDPARVPLLDEEQEEMALAVLDGEVDVDPDEELGDSLDNPLASLDMAGAAMGHPLDSLDVLFPGEDDDDLELYGDALDELLQEDG